MQNTLKDDLALLARGEYGDLPEAYDCFLQLEAIFRKHKPHLSGRRLEPISVLRGLHAEISEAYPEAHLYIEGLGRPASAMVLIGPVAQACADLLNELYFYLRDFKVLAGRTLRPDPDIAQILQLV